MTKKEQTARSAQLLELSGDHARRALQRIHDILWPAKGPDREWSPDTLEEIAGIYSGLLPVEPTTRIG